MVSNRPFQALRDRLAGRPIDVTRYEDVPDWLEPPLRSWLYQALQRADDVARAVCLRMRKAKPTRATYASVVASTDRADLLEAVDAVLQLHRGWDAPRDYLADTFWSFDEWARCVVDLADILHHGGSVFRVDIDERQLVRRVDETVQGAMDTAVASAPKGAGGHLRTAWAAAYGRDPDPDKAFNEAVRAVEEVACPLVEQKRAGSNASTLGTVIGALNSASHKWELLLPAKDGHPRNPASLVGMMEMLWNAQLSRHGGGANSRRQNQEEAEAAVHLAALLVQWLSVGVLRKKL